MVCACKTMRTIRFCAVLVSGCAVFAVGVAVGGAGQGLQRYQIVTHSGQAAGISHRLDRWTGETWVCMPAVHPGSRWQWHPMPVAGYPWEAAQPVAAQPVPPALPQSSGNVQFLPTPPPMDGAIRIQNGHSYRYNAATGRWE
jgi:hypothetical protein